MFNPMQFQNTRIHGIAALELVSEGGARLFVPLRVTQLSGRVCGPLADLRLTHVFGFPGETLNRTVEAIYRFPLPGDAAVTGVRVTFGQVEIEATLQERAQAEADYEEAVAGGRQAALTTRETPDVFTLQIAGIEPGQDVRVETSFIVLTRAQPSGLGWSLRVPVTTPPRYVRGDETGTTASAAQPLMTLLDPGHRFGLDLEILGEVEITSPTHDLEVKPGSSGSRITLAGGEVLPDRDLQLSYRPAEEGRRRAALTVFSEDSSDYRYLLALVSPPTASSAPALKREVVLLVDHSGSMEGAKWAASDWAAKRLLAGLGNEDSFALGVFHDVTSWFTSKPVAASSKNVVEAGAFLKRSRDSGGTQLGVALEQALGLSRTDGERARNVLIVTDAAVGDRARILRLAEAEALRDDRRRISVLCIDAAPNALLVHELAERGGGAARFLTSDPDEEDITTALDEVLAEWAAPVATGCRLQLEAGGLLASGRGLVSPQEIDLGDLVAGRAVWVVARVDLTDGANARLVDWTGKVLAEAGFRSVSMTAIRAIFGARRVMELEDLATSYATPAELLERLRRMGFTDQILGLAGGASVYPENERSKNAVNALLTTEALTYGLVSSQTAFLATRKERGHPVEATVAVGNAIPQGWPRDMATAAMPMMGLAAPRPAKASGLLSRIVIVFSGTPRVESGRALLFDSGMSSGVLPSSGLLTALSVTIAHRDRVDDRGLAIEIYFDDLVSPRARVFLRDLLAQGGTRPLNIRLTGGQAIQMVLRDPNGAWGAAPPSLQVAFEIG